MQLDPQGRGQHRKRAHSRTPSPDAEAVLFKNSRLTPPVGGPPQASDYDKRTEDLINLAVRHFTVKVYTVHAFPSSLQAEDWAQEVWLSVCRKIGKRFKPDDNNRIIRVVRKMCILAWNVSS